MTRSLKLVLGALSLNLLRKLGAALRKFWLLLLLPVQKEHKGCYTFFAVIVLLISADLACSIAGAVHFTFFSKRLLQNSQHLYMHIDR